MSVKLAACRASTNIIISLGMAYNGKLIVCVCCAILYLNLLRSADMSQRSCHKNSSPLLLSDIIQEQVEVATSHNVRCHSN